MTGYRDPWVRSRLTLAALSASMLFVFAYVDLPTIIASAIGEWGYFVVGSALEAALLLGIVYYAWTWPTATERG